MSWHWRKLASCDLDELLDDLNPAMKDLEGAMSDDRPAIMSGYPKARGAIVSNIASSHTGDLVETTLKTFDFGRGALKDKSGFRVHAAGTRTGGAGTINLKLKWGGETLCTLNVAAVDGQAWSIMAEVWNLETTQDQRYLIHAWDATTLETMTVNTISVDTL